MDEIRGNSLRSREDATEPIEPRVRPALTQPATTKKRSGVSGFLKSLIVEDAVSIRDHIIEDILRPAIGNFIMDTVIDSVEMFFGGDRRSRSSSVATNRVSYRGCYDDRRETVRRDDDKYRGYMNENPVVPSRADAIKVQDAMFDIMDKYKYVRVADLLELCILPSVYTDNKYGWDSYDEIRAMKMIRLRDGSYELEMPRAHELSK